MSEHTLPQQDGRPAMSDQGRAIFDIALGQVAQSLADYRALEVGSEPQEFEAYTVLQQERFMLKALCAVDAMDPSVAEDDKNAVLAEMEAEYLNIPTAKPLDIAADAISRYQARVAIPTVRR